MQHKVVTILNNGRLYLCLTLQLQVQRNSQKGAAYVLNKY